MESHSSLTESRNALQNPEFWRDLCARRDLNPVTPWNAEERKALRDFNIRSGAGPEVLVKIEALAGARALAVVAGQQAGVFLSPLYVLYKAIGAIGWARRLEKWLERPVVPIFWIASEDHDFEEVRHAHYFDSAGKPRRWTYEPSQAIAPGTSVGDIAAQTEALGSFLDALAADTRDTEFKGPLLERWRACVAEADTLEDLFAHGMADLLSRYGLVLLPSRLGPLRRRAAAILAREIERPGETARLVRDAADAWQGAGDAPPIHRRGNEANFFLYRRGVRCKVTVEAPGEGVFLIHNPSDQNRVERADARALRAELEAAPERFSPNVVTRPVIQDAALPTLAMLGGPGEARYLALLARAGIHAHFGAFASQVLPRPRALLIEPRIERHLSRAGVETATLEREDWRTLEETFLRSEGFGFAFRALENLQAASAEAFAALRADLGDLARTPQVAGAMEKTEKNWKDSAERLGQRVRSEIEQEQKTASAHATTVLDALRPLGQTQERILGPLAPFLINYGPRFVSWLVETLDLDASGLQVLELGTMAKNEATQSKETDEKNVQ